MTPANVCCCNNLITFFATVITLIVIRGALALLFEDHSQLFHELKTNPAHISDCFVFLMSRLSVRLSLCPDSLCCTMSSWLLHCCCRFKLLNRDRRAHCLLFVSLLRTHQLSLACVVTEIELCCLCDASQRYRSTLNKVATDVLHKFKQCLQQYLG